MQAAEATTREIDIAVGDLIGKTFDRADQILQVRRADLDAGAKLLPKRETLTADDFPAIRSAKSHRRAAANGCSIDYIFGLSGNVVHDRFAGREAGMIKAD